MQDAAMAQLNQPGDQRATAALLVGLQVNNARERMIRVDGYHRRVRRKSRDRVGVEQGSDQHETVDAPVAKTTDAPRVAFPIVQGENRGVLPVPRRGREHAVEHLEEVVVELAPLDNRHDADRAHAPTDEGPGRRVGSVVQPRRRVEYPGPGLGRDTRRRAGSVQHRGSRHRRHPGLAPHIAEGGGANGLLDLRDAGHDLSVCKPAECLPSPAPKCRRKTSRIQICMVMTSLRGMLERNLWPPARALYFDLLHHSAVFHEHGARNPLPILSRRNHPATRPNPVSPRTANNRSDFIP